ncbi:DUF2497 domain-containing protein [Bartonella bacilliformis]|uniref:Cell pole-organizing protein PopZ n=1 Tax=Bartonella bacilliformis Ver097 TaxID=1293911 RepID=A0A072R2I6_BARBA|nr:DUF2497 domain-containing protein [Bartonella bacilliformis]KEG19557.1 hypothetical protein H710_00765 [Bartonella bacilliformis Ver097]KEG20148.1 hypothetical protein H710_00754 [Bartonella bacilliformis Ver097]
MVQSSSALREPSMDEILTSIREIIEENAIQADQVSNKVVMTNSSSEKNSTVPLESLDESALSVDDAIKALADRIGIPSDDEDLSFVHMKNNAEVENNTVGLDMQKMKFFSEEQMSVHKTGQADTHVSQQGNTISDCVGSSACFVSSAEKIAEDILRPAIAEWLQRELPVVLEKILREEIVKTIKKLP